jgi:hypothetical protein
MIKFPHFKIRRLSIGSCGLIPKITIKVRLTYDVTLAHETATQPPSSTMTTSADCYAMTSQSTEYHIFGSSTSQDGILRLTSFKDYHSHQGVQRSKGNSTPL